MSFCLPLFVGLGRTDLETDEAIYSFAVDRILEIGDWLAPKSSPSETEVFLEKPPLKFWIVAAGIKGGLLPHTEFGLRFWDALFGGLAFLYVYLIGCALANPLCGILAVLLLFVHGPLLFEHGLRSNNMESALVLSYCGGVWHFLRWSESDAPDRQRLHAVAVALFFVLGFMVKFVAALFLPVVLLVGAVAGPFTRQQIMRTWPLWTTVLALVLLLIAPWFVYTQLRFPGLWNTMAATHVYVRFTSSLNPTHVQPWHFYFSSIYRHFADSKVAWLVLLGTAALFVHALRRPSLVAWVVLVWAALPLVGISLGSSKLYHYAFPFLPPLALAASYVATVALLVARAPARRVLQAAERFIARRWPPLATARDGRWFPWVTSAVIWLAASLAIAAAMDIPIRLTLTPGFVVKNSSVLRPVLAMVLAAVLAGRSARAVQLVALLTILSIAPLGAYVSTLSRLRVEKHPIRSVRDCIRKVQARDAHLRPGLYADVEKPISHPGYYYLRQVRPWTRQETPGPSALDQYLHNPSVWQPSLVDETRYRAYQSGPEAGRFAGVSPPLMSIPEQILFLPGPYTVCSPEAALHGPR